VKERLPKPYLILIFVCVLVAILGIHRLCDSTFRDELSTFAEPTTIHNYEYKMYSCKRLLHWWSRRLSSEQIANIKTQLSLLREQYITNKIDEINSELAKTDRSDYSIDYDLEQLKEFLVENNVRDSRVNSLENKILSVRKEERSNEGVRIGMTKEEVLMSNWGIPYDINKTVTRYGVHEQWCYRGYNYLYFENGILVTVQN